MKQKTQRLRIATLKRGGWEKRVYLGAKDTKESEESFALALREIDKLGDKIATWPEFLSAAYEVFSKYGFTRVEP